MQWLILNPKEGAWSNDFGWVPPWQAATLATRFTTWERNRFEIGTLGQWVEEDEAIPDGKHLAFRHAGYTPQPWSDGKWLAPVNCISDDAGRDRRWSLIEGSSGHLLMVAVPPSDARILAALLTRQAIQCESEVYAWP